jgi:hypothetical protein
LISLARDVGWDYDYYYLLSFFTIKNLSDLAVTRGFNEPLAVTAAQRPINATCTAAEQTYFMIHSTAFCAPSFWASNGWHARHSKFKSSLLNKLISTGTSVLPTDYRLPVPVL